MTPLEAARRLITGQRLTHPCAYCGHMMPDHDTSCPIHTLPQIVAALEAAERVARASAQIDLDGLTDKQEWDSAWQSDALKNQFLPSVRALVAALKGETDG